SPNRPDINRTFQKPFGIRRCPIALANEREFLKFMNLESQKIFPVIRYLNNIDLRKRGNKTAEIPKHVIDIIGFQVRRIYPGNLPIRIALRNSDDDCSTIPEISHGEDSLNQFCFDDVPCRTLLEIDTLGFLT